MDTRLSRRRFAGALAVLSMIPAVRNAPPAQAATPKPATPSNTPWFGAEVPTGTVKIGLFTEEPPLVAEVSGGGYERPTITLHVEDGVVFNQDTVRFPTPKSDWGRVSALGAFIGDNLIFYGPLVARRNVMAGDSICIPSGALVLTVD